MDVYRPSNCCCFFLYWGHCECLASLVGAVRVLSAVIFLRNCFMNEQNDDDDENMAVYR